MDRKHCGKWRNCSLRAISPFPTVFSKDLYCRHIKPGLVWERVKESTTEAFGNIVRIFKEEIACNKQFLLFPQCFVLNQKIVSPFVNIFVISLFAAELEEPEIGMWSKGLNSIQIQPMNYFHLWSSKGAKNLCYMYIYWDGFTVY